MSRWEEGSGGGLWSRCVPCFVFVPLILAILLALVGIVVCLAGE